MSFYLWTKYERDRRPTLGHVPSLVIKICLFKFRDRKKYVRKTKAHWITVIEITISGFITRN